MPRVCAVVVTFNPDLERLRIALNALRGQCDEVVVVDNASSVGSRPDAASMALDRRSLVVNRRNEGLGAALNAGARLALSRGATHLLFLDQDSVPELNMVARLLEALSRPAAPPVGAAGPQWIDLRTRQRGGEVNETADAEFLITSGMLVPTEVFGRVGPFDESLFVDSTDLEWCFRAKSMGYRFLSVAWAGLGHQLGDRPVRVFGRVLTGWTHHRPQRLYYMMRNRVLLYHRSYVPLRWKCYDVFRAFGKLLVFSVFFAPRLSNVRWMLAGLRDGLRGKAGPLD